MIDGNDDDKKETSPDDTPSAETGQENEEDGVTQKQVLLVMVFFFLCAVVGGVLGMAGAGSQNGAAGTESEIVREAEGRGAEKQSFFGKIFSFNFGFGIENRIIEDFNLEDTPEVRKTIKDFFAKIKEADKDYKGLNLKKKVLECMDTAQSKMGETKRKKPNVSDAEFIDSIIRLCGLSVILEEGALRGEF